MTQRKRRGVERQAAISGGPVRTAGPRRLLKNERERASRLFWKVLLKRLKKYRQCESINLSSFLRAAAAAPVFPSFVSLLFALPVARSSHSFPFSLPSLPRTSLCTYTRTHVVHTHTYTKRTVAVCPAGFFLQKRAHVRRNCSATAAAAAAALTARRTISLRESRYVGQWSVWHRQWATAAVRRKRGRTQQCAPL